MSKPFRGTVDADIREWAFAGQAEKDGWATVFAAAVA